MKRPLLCICIMIILFRFLFVSYRRESETELFPKEECVVSGEVVEKESKKIVLSSVILHGHSCKCLSEPNSVYSNLTCVKLNGNLIIEDDMSDKYFLGSNIYVKGELKAYAHATNPGEFDQKDYYQSLNIVGNLKKAQLLCRSNSYSEWRELLYGLKNFFSEKLYEVFPQKEASVMATLLLGEKTELDPEIKEQYKRNGIIHVLSISGLHIAVIGMGIYECLRRIGIRNEIACAVGLFILLCYGSMTGMGISATRAIWMYGIKMFSKITGKTYDLLTAMGIPCALTAIVKPYCYLNAGFWLSYGAIIGIGGVYPALEKQFLRGRNPVFSYIGKSVLSSLSIQLITMPIMLWFYYEIPIHSVFLNLLILPFMSVLMYLGIFIMVIPYMGWLKVGVLCILRGIDVLCILFEKMGFSMWNPGKPKALGVTFFYILSLFLLYIMCSQKKETSAQKSIRKYYRAIAVCIILTNMVISVSFQGWERKNRIVFLDVGQGDCIFVQTFSGENYLFDCGSSGKKKIGEKIVVPFLKYYSVNKLNYVLISHNDADHMNGVEQLQEEAQKEGIVIQQIAGSESVFGGMEIKTDYSSVQCLHPCKDFVGKDNEKSQCFYVKLWDKKTPEEKGISLLLTGDVEGKGEESLKEELITKGIDRFLILKVSHHGSGYSTTENFLEGLDIKSAVISVGKNNSYGHPHEKTLKRLEEKGTTIFRTDQDGAVTFWLDKGKINAETFTKKR